MAAKDLYTLLGRSNQQTTQQMQQNLMKTGANNNGSSAMTKSNASGNKTKKMVKQHSTASQQSTSSTSSSVQSAPEQGTSKQQSPSRFSTSSLERQILPQHLQQHHFKPPKSVTPMTFPSLDRDFLSSVSTLQSAGSLKSEELLLPSHIRDSNSNVSESYHSDTQLHTTDKHAPDAGNVSVKKRKKGLRFGFGSKKSQSVSSSSDTSSKSKNT